MRLMKGDSFLRFVRWLSLRLSYLRLVRLESYGTNLRKFELRSSSSRYVRLLMTANDLGDSKRYYSFSALL